MLLLPLNKFKQLICDYDGTDYDDDDDNGTNSLGSRYNNSLCANMYVL